MDCFFADGYDYPNGCPVYDTKKSHGKTPIMRKLWGMRSAPFITIPLCTGVVAPERVLSMGQIELNSVLMLNRIA